MGWCVCTVLQKNIAVYAPGVSTVNEGMAELFWARSVPMGSRPSAITPSPDMATAGTQ